MRLPSSTELRSGYGVWLVGWLCLISSGPGCATLASPEAWKSGLNRGLTWSGNREERISASRQISRNGSEWAGRGKSTEAIASFQEAIRIWPSDIRNYLELAKQYTALEQHAAAAATLRQGLKYDQNNVEVRLQLAHSLAAQGFGDAAHEQLNEVLRTDKDLAAAWLLRAKINHQQGRYDEALADAYQAEARQQVDNELLELLCQVYFCQGRPNRAWSIVQRLNAQYPNGQRPAHLIVLEAEALCQMNRKREALQTLQQWYHAGGDQDPKCCVMLAELHQELTSEASSSVAQASGIGAFDWNPLATQIGSTTHPGWGQASDSEPTPLALLYPMTERPKFRPLEENPVTRWDMLR
ncbi:MAG: tetratricopeptide repeat protein [Planctomycetaceae bacterium]|nr:tetratricopeptide repeat protein [Planctomycetaceae bacterium]